MTSLQNILEATGLPVTYRQWYPTKPPELPYLVFLVEGWDSFGADDIAYVSSRNVQIELYSNEKDETSEEAVAGALTSAGIYFEAIETYIEKERLYMVAFSINWTGSLFAEPVLPEEPEEPEDPGEPGDPEQV